jgi:hypothetical protein
MFGWGDDGGNEAFLFRDDIEVNVAYIKRATKDERYRTSEGCNDQHDGSGGLFKVKQDQQNKKLNNLKSKPGTDMLNPHITLSNQDSRPNPPRHFKINLEPPLVKLALIGIISYICKV